MPASDESDEVGRSMAGFARKSGGALSTDARKRIAALKPYPTLDMWRNPVTRGFARRLQNEDWQKSLDEIDFDYRLTPSNSGGIDGIAFETENDRTGAPLIFFVHGGGFVAGGPDINAAIVLPGCYLSGSQAFGPRYTLLPDAHYPSQIDDIATAYEAICVHHPEKRVVLMADSSGAAIALSALLRWRDAGLQLPVGTILLSPCVDGKGESDTQITLDKHDPLIRSMRGGYVRSLFRFYAPGAALDDPDVSPLYGDFTGLPPMLIQAGSREVLLGDAARLEERARRAGVDIRLQVFDGMYHRFHEHWSLPETKAAHQDIADFIRSL